MNKKVIIATPSHIIGQGLTSIINRKTGFSAISVDGLRQCIERGCSISSDVVIIDLSLFVPLSRMNIYSTFPELHDKVVVCLISGVSDNRLINQFDGSINIYDDEDNIIRKLNNAIENCNIQTRHISDDISEREREVLVLIAEGMINKEIADKLNISVHTVIAHRKNISRKTGIKSVAGLTMYAMMNHILELH